MIEKIKEIEQFYMNGYKTMNDEDLDPKIIQDYMRIQGVDKQEREDVESLFSIQFTKDLLAIYEYKNGSAALPLLILNDQETFRLLSLASMVEVKMYFQNQDEKAKEVDDRIKPYIQNRLWFVFAANEAENFLMFDYDPTDKGKQAQIIKYNGENDTIEYISDSLESLIQNSLQYLTK